MTDLQGQLDGAVLVVAHPDDEILWFSSVLDEVAGILICYLDVPGDPRCTAGRRTVAEQYPHAKAEFLGITESVPYRGADWNEPRETTEGLDVQRRPGTLPGFDAERYRRNFASLVEALTARLDGVRAVITHNPWGEYGNEEHVQVYRAVKAAQRGVPFDLWYSNYCSDRAYRLMLRHIDGRRSDYVSLPTRPDRVAAIEALYRDNDCWTWPFDDYRYFERECFLLDEGRPLSRQDRGSTIPLNYIKVVDKPVPSQQHARFTPRRIAGAVMRRVRRAFI